MKAEYGLFCGLGSSATLRLAFGLKLAVVFRSALGGRIAAKPAGLGYDEFFWNGFSAVWTFHAAQNTTRLAECLQAATI